MLNNLVRAITATNPLAAQQADLYELIRAANGTFLRAQRDTFSVIAPLSHTWEPNAAVIQPQFHLHVPKVPLVILRQILKRSLEEMTNEILFYLVFESSWKLIEPPQMQKMLSVTTFGCPFSNGADLATIEIHSHHLMDASFSVRDNQDESGFRLYAVLGSLPYLPTLRLRVGIYHQTFWEIPARWVFELPSSVQDALDKNHEN